MRLDFFARRAHYLDHLAPIYQALPAARRGVITVPAEIYAYARQEIPDAAIETYNGDSPRGNDPILVASYGDIARAARRPRKIIHMEHGTGHAFGTAPYPNGTKGKRDLVDLFLAPNEYTARLIRSVRATRVEVIGTPKLDPAGQRADRPASRPTIAIAFHWGDRSSNPPEAGSAYEHYKAVLPDLARRYRLFGHGHPLAREFYRKEFEDMGIDWLDDFRDVCRLADIYVNDLSSTLYEFLVTGKPVVVLNAPWFRRDVRWGLRFWDYSDVGINVNEPEELLPAIERTWCEYDRVHITERTQAVSDLYPYLGHAAQAAAQVLTTYLAEWEDEHVHVAA
jgi:hypothetical protein